MWRVISHLTIEVAVEATAICTVDGLEQRQPAILIEVLEQQNWRAAVETAGATRHAADDECGLCSRQHVTLQRYDTLCVARYRLTILTAACA